MCNLCEWGVYIPQTSDSPNSKPCLPSKPNIMLSLVQDPRLGSPVWDLAPVFLGEKLCGCCFPPVCGSLTLAYESCLYCSLTPSIHLAVVSSLYLYLLKLFSGGFWYLPVDGCSTANCDLALWQEMSARSFATVLSQSLETSIICKYPFLIMLSNFLLSSTERSKVKKDSPVAQTVENLPAMQETRV